MFYTRLNSLRLKNWDYRSSGYYFITICTKNGENYFGDIINHKMQLSKIGFLAKRYWKEIPKHFSFIKLDAFIIMPNHIHGILMIKENGIVGALHCNVPTDCKARTQEMQLSRGSSYHQNPTKRYVKSKSISAIIGSYKSICTRKINRIQNKIFFAWHRNFYDHIIRTNEDLYNTRLYIKNNPKHWENDRNYKK